MENNEVTVIAGKCGEDIAFSFDGSVLRISGSGAMYNYTDPALTPFADFRSSVSELVIEDGIESIGNCAFGGFTAVTRLYVPGSVDVIGSRAFGECTALTSVTLGEGVRVIGPKAFEKCPRLTWLEFPSSLRSVDFKAFIKSEGVREIKYAGTAVEWKRRVRVGRSSHGNASIFGAHFSFRDNTRRYDEMTARIGDVIRAGGDGAMYIVTPDLTVEEYDGKSGDCTLIVFPDGKTMMIDAGAPPCWFHVVELLAGAGIKRLDYFALSHPHGDHYGGASKAAEYLFSQGGGIGTYLYSGLDFKTGEKKLARLLAAHGTEMRRDLCEGDELEIGDVAVNIFNPRQEDLIIDENSDMSDGGVNNISVGMKFIYGNVSYLTAGDLYAVRERELVERLGGFLRSDAAKTNHHGVFTSNTPEWTEAVGARVLVSDSDDAPWTVFEERLRAAGTPNYIVSDCGLCVLRLTADGGITAETEY